MKPFLVLQLRPNDQASEGEFQAFLKHGGIQEKDTHRVRMELEGIPPVDFDDYSGIIVGGGPFDMSTPEEKKSPEQNRLERELDILVARIVEADFPYLGACFGFSVLVKYLGGTVSKERYDEPVGPTTIKLTEEGEQDPLLAGLSPEFRAFCGHKEACQGLPEGATLLATSDPCPIQMIKVKKNVYALQFHSELDLPGIIERIQTYKHAGYFPPEDAQDLIDIAEKENVTVPMKIIKRFVDRYTRD